MSSRPDDHSLQTDLHSTLAQSKGVYNLHSSEGNLYSRDQLRPHLTISEFLNSEVNRNLNPVQPTQCGNKRNRASTFEEEEDTMFKSNFAHGRLFSNTPEDSLQAKGGLNESAFPSKDGSHQPFGTFAGLYSTFGSRGRTISTASDTTIFSLNQNKAKCHRCHRPLDAMMDSCQDQPSLKVPSQKGMCLSCTNLSLNKDTISSPLLSVMTSGRDSEDEYASDFHLNEDSSMNNLNLLTRMSYQPTESTFKLGSSGVSSAVNSPGTNPIRLTNIFTKPSCFLGDSLNKREKKESELKKRSMSYDVTATNKLVCDSCGKQEFNVLSIKEPSEVSQSHLCTKCSSALSKKQDYASIKGGSAKVSSKRSNSVEFTCEKGHSWHVNLHRGYKNWCSTCLKLAKEELKKEYKRQSSQVNRENADRQKILFDNAKVQYVQSQSELSPKNINFEDLFESITPVAKAKADAYLAHPDASPSCTYEQVLSVYRILELDATRVKFILKGMSADSKKVGYKKLALSLHPDKNRHPLSNEAFLKASELFKSST